MIQAHLSEKAPLIGVLSQVIISCSRKFQINSSIFTHKDKCHLAVLQAEANINEMAKV